MKARALLDRLQYHNIAIQVGDGSIGWPRALAFDAIIVTAAWICRGLYSINWRSVAGWSSRSATTSPRCSSGSRVMLRSSQRNNSEIVDSSNCGGNSVGRNRREAPHPAVACFHSLFCWGCASQTTISKPRPQGTYHVVTPGETLFLIGKAYGVAYQELARINGIKDAGQIKVGQRIFIPGRPVHSGGNDHARGACAGSASFTRAGVRDISLAGKRDDQLGIWTAGSSFHDGIDIAAPEGTPILAIEAGEVIYSDQLRGYGNMVILRHAGGIVSVYAHNESNLVRGAECRSR